MSKQKTKIGKQNPTSHFAHHKSQKGITLIALIITIIVMLILVGVTVTVALNGGLFSTAQNAKEVTQEERDKELALDEGRVKVNEVWYNTLQDYTDGIPSSDQGETVVTLPEGLEVGDEFEMDADQDGTDETWIVLHAGTEANSHLNENEIEVISKNVMGGTLALGSGDESAQTPGDIDSDRTANSNLDKAIYSFENSVNRLNSYCEGLIKIKNNGVRSVGSNPSDKTYVNTAHTEDSKVTHLADWTDAGKTAWNKYKLLVGTTDENSNTDFNKMDTLEIKVANNNEGTESFYWLASRNVNEAWSSSSASGEMYFSVRLIDKSGDMSQNYLWKQTSRGGTYPNLPASFGVRPVVKLQYP